MRFQCTFCFTIIRSKPGETRLNCPNCNKMVAVPKSRFETGCVIEDFVIENVIGYGGMATVYLAKQLSLDRPVALKVLSDEYCKRETFRASFLKEAKAAARLNHPNIIQATRVGEEDGILYYAMEYVQGQTLANKIDVEKTLQIDPALNIAQQCAEALHAAWTQEGLIHRDIKPDNVMLAEDGYSKIMDLGIAITVEEAESAEVSGTPTYMAPEQFRRERLDCRTDIYSLGVTLYHSLVGFPPFDGENVKEIARKHVFNQLQFPSNDLIYLPQRIKRLISKMMAKEPNDRYQDYDELLGDIVALRKRLAPDKDQVPNVHTISFSKYRLHEKMSDSPSEIYRRRSDKKKKVAIAKERSSKSEKTEQSKAPWLLIGGLVVVILLLSLGILKVVLTDNEFETAVNQYFIDSGKAGFHTQDLTAKESALKQQIKAVDELLARCPKNPSNTEEKAKYSLIEHKGRLNDELYDVRDRLVRLAEENLANRNAELNLKQKKAGYDQNSVNRLKETLRQLQEEQRKLLTQIKKLDSDLRKSETDKRRLADARTKLQRQLESAAAEKVAAAKIEAEVSIVDYCQGFRYLSAQRVVDQLEESFPHIKPWARTKKAAITDAEAIYEAVYNSGDTLRGVTVSAGIVQEIDRNIVTLLATKDNIVSRIETRLSKLELKDIITLAEQNWKGDQQSFNRAKYNFAICSGEFAIAKALKKNDPKASADLKAHIEAYLKQCTREVRLYLRTGNKKAASTRYKSLKAFRNLKEFETIEDELKELSRSE